MKPQLTADVDSVVWSNWQTSGFESSPASDGAEHNFFASGSNSEHGSLSTTLSVSSTEATGSNPSLEGSSGLATFFFLINTGPCLELVPFKICRRPLLRTMALAACEEVFLPSRRFSNDRRNLANKVQMSISNWQISGGLALVVMHWSWSVNLLYL